MDYDRQTLLSMLNQLNLQGFEEAMFDIFKEAETWDELLDLVDEQIQVEKEWPEVEKWLAEHGDKESS